MTFWQKYEELCLDKGFKPSSETAMRITGVSSPAITAWKKGAMPKIDVVQKIADYFNVDILYLLGLSDKKHSENIIEKITDHLMDCGVEVDTFDDDNGTGTEYVLTYKGKSFNYQEHDYKSLCHKIAAEINTAELFTVDKFCRTTFGGEKLTNTSEENQLLKNYRKLSPEGKLMVRSCIITELRRQEDGRK